ncbi:hypothetical protein ACVME8_006597 [Bradyrhizobium diazoefficiens]
MGRERRLQYSNQLIKNKTFVGALLRLQIVFKDTLRIAACCAARKLVEIAAGITPTQESRTSIELVNVPFLKAGGSGERSFAPASQPPGRTAGSNCMRAALNCD